MSDAKELKAAADAAMPYVLMYMELADAMGYGERGRENELVSPEEWAQDLFEGRATLPLDAV